MKLNGFAADGAITQIILADLSKTGPQFLSKIRTENLGAYIWVGPYSGLTVWAFVHLGGASEMRGLSMACDFPIEHLLTA